jgi:4-carboxymuconolactone decarboxylase
MWRQSITGSGPAHHPLRMMRAACVDGHYEPAMPKDAAVSESRDLLRRLAANDERSVRAVLALSPAYGGRAQRSALDRRTRWLVHLAALLVVGASPESLRWATELACTSGADDSAVAAVLLAAAPAAGSAQVVAAAPRLALALGLEPVGDAAPH